MAEPFFSDCFVACSDCAHTFAAIVTNCITLAQASILDTDPNCPVSVYQGLSLTGAGETLLCAPTASLLLPSPPTVVQTNRGIARTETANKSPPEPKAELRWAALSSDTQ